MFDASHPPAADRAPTPYRDLARFHPDDDDELVSASFACPLCLQVDVSVHVSDDNGLGTITDCRCHRCASGWQVLVDDGQLLRLTRLVGGRRGTRRRLDVRFGEDWL